MAIDRIGHQSYFARMFRLPEVSYPLWIDTIGKMLALGHEAAIHCLTPDCGHAARLGLVALGHRLGFEH